MENFEETVEQQNRADDFWQTYFADHMGKRIDEQYALDNDLWGKLQTALEATDDIDTIWAIIFADPAIQITSADMHSRIARTAKQVWHRKQSPHIK